MKRMMAGFMAAALAMTGCGQESEPGGPGAGNGAAGGNMGANGENGDDSNREAVDPDTAFHMVVPAGATNVEAGQTAQVSLSLERGDQFNQDVTLSFQPPPGVTITPQQPVIKSGQDSIDVTIQVAADAAPGTASITAQATPADGKAVSEPFDIEITAVEQRN